MPIKIVNNITDQQLIFNYQKKKKKKIIRNFFVLIIERSSIS